MEIKHRGVTAANTRATSRTLLCIRSVTHTCLKHSGIHSEEKHQVSCTAHMTEREEERERGGKAMQ